MLAQDGAQTHDYRGQRTLDMSVRVSNKFLDNWQNTVHYDVFSLVSIQGLTEVLHFMCSSSSNFSFSVFQKSLECWHQIDFGDISSNCFLKLGYEGVISELYPMNKQQTTWNT